jgi:hypothetical protein
MASELAMIDLLSILLSPLQSSSFLDAATAIYALLLLIFGIVLALVGRRLVKVLFFLAGGILGASISFTVFSSWFSSIPPMFGAILGFAVVGGLAYLFAPLAFGLILAALGYLVSGYFISLIIIPIVIAVACFIIGILLFNHFLSIATAIGGGMMVWYSLQTLGLPAPISPIMGIILMVLGVYVQLRKKKVH